MPLNPVSPSILCIVRRPAARTKPPAVVSPSPSRALVPISPGPKGSELKSSDLSPTTPPPPASHPSAVFFPLAPAALSQSQGTTLHASRAPARANLPCAPSWPRTAGSPGPRTYSRVQRGRGTGRSEAELAFRPRGRRPELGRLGPQRARLALGSLGSHPTHQAGAQKAEVFGGEKHSFF